MPSESQFAIWLEVSRLLPLVFVADKAAPAVMQLARSLQNSGSDIVIEEDLAKLFGRSRIAAQCESSFKTVVTQSTGTSPVHGTIFLQKGPGPPVADQSKSVPTSPQSSSSPLLS